MRTDAGGSPQEYINHSPPPLAPGCVGFCQWEAQVGDQRVGGERPGSPWGLCGPTESLHLRLSASFREPPPPFAPFS